ncbi:MAG TPA: cobalamin-binding protein [Usitatibacteraceae bacterium]
MKSRTTVLALLTALALPCASAQAVSVVDDNGKVVALAKPAERIVSLAPSLTELIFAAGAGGKLVAVSAYSDFPAAAKGLPQVADAAGVSLEALLALKPDLVIAWKSGNRDTDIKRVAEFGVPVFVLEVAKLADVPQAIRAIGKLGGTTAIAEPEARRIEGRFETLRRANLGKRKVRMFFEISRLPLMTVNRHHAIDEVISLCGGVNVFRDQVPLVFTPSLEELFRLQPEAILYPANEPTPPAPQYRGLRAWDEQRIYQVGADALLRTGPRLAEGARQVCAALDRARASSIADRPR